MSVLTRASLIPRSLAVRSAAWLATGGRGSRRLGGTAPEPVIYDVAVIGAGIVGLATARELLLRYPGKKVAVLDKEPVVGFHQTGHNSGVMHAGIYYAPGSLKAKLCVEGLQLAYAYCDARGIPYEKCGKLIVAVTEDELPGLEQLYKRGVANGVKDLCFMSPAEFKKVEPHCNGIRAIHSPHTGIVDWGLFARCFPGQTSNALRVWGLEPRVH
ncbi:FAD dependent oxidoreductase-domain-containing protein [Baffinella frigidus]|nr:FAD dependent oxidoreductase-domain-containing protein [Cryptophyta sp. CCMP2293]